jgi:hypothetical protein
MANDLWLLNDGTSKILLNNGTDRLALNSEAAAEVTVDMWHRTGGMIRRAATLAVIGQITFAAVPVPADVPVVKAADTAVVYTKTVLAPAYASCPHVPDIADRWFQPFSTPLRAEPRAAEYQAFSYAPYVEVAVETVTVDKWHRQHGVHFTKPYVTVTGDIQFGAIPPVPTDTFSVVGAADVPIVFNQTRLSPAYAYSPYVEVVAEVVTSDKWFVPPSQPVRAKPRLEGDFTAAPTQPQANDGIGWYRPFSDPTRRKTFLEADIAFSPTQPEANDGIGWHRPFNEPTRRKVFLEGDVAYNPALIEDAAIQAKWFQPFGIPRAAKRVPEFPAYSYSPYFVPPVSGIGTEFNWWPNLSERIRVRIPVAQQQAIIQGPQTPIAVTLEYAYLRPWSEPTRRVVTNLDPIPYSPYVEQAEIVTLDKWYVELDIPTRGKPRPEGDFTLAPFPQVPQPDGWWQPLDEPTRRKSFREGEYSFDPFPQVSGPDRWWQDFDLPTRRKVPTGFHTEPVQPSFVPAPSYGWFVKLDEPTKRKVFNSLYRPNFNVEIEFTPSGVYCSHTTLIFPTAQVAVLFGTAETAELTPTAETAALYPEAETTVLWPTATTTFIDCED